jgi:serine/threonine protein kinase
VLGQSTINGIYHSPELLSEAGYFSAVFNAKRAPGGKRVVLKFFVDTTGDAYRRHAFDREGRLLSGILKGEERFVQLVDPPAILQVEAKLQNGKPLILQLPFLAFERMNGGDIEQLAGTPLQTPQEALLRLVWFREMVRSVNRLHFLNCFHRDLKPGNFLFDNTPSCREVKLSDFGTIRLCDGSPTLLSEYRGRVGDLRYSAPELLSGVAIPQEWHRLADVYSLGAILFELMTCRQLIETTFGDVSRAILFTQHMTTVPVVNRLTAFHGFLESNGYTIPEMRAVNPLIPRCIAPKLDDILSAMVEFDYRRRAADLSRIVRLLDICRLVLSNEQRSQTRLARR